METRKIRFSAPLLFFALLLTGLLFAAFLNGSPSHAENSHMPRESAEHLEKTGMALAELTAAVRPAIVNISTTRTVKISGGMDPFFDDPFFRRFFGDRFGRQQPERERKSSGLGSGVIVSPDGYIITNSHVVKEADEIKVLLSDRKEYAGTVIGSDPKTEIAVIKIDAKNLHTLPWGDSDRLRVGEFVLAVGNPYGLNQTVTMGIVSALGRANVGIADYEDFIQTDAAINPGNSGGALVNVRGELIGINTAIYSTSGGYQGIGFAIPSNMVRSVMESLVKKGKVIRGWLGVSIQKVTPELAKQFSIQEDQGALIGDIIEGSPAEKAGIKRGDVIIEYDGKKIEEPYMLRNMVANTIPGEDHEVTLLRDNQRMRVKVTIGELPAEQQALSSVDVDVDNVLRGVVTQDITPDIAKKLNLPARIKGVIISDIDENSPASGILSQGDIIREVNRKAVPDSETYRNIVTKIGKGEDVLLLVYRGGSSLYVTISQK